jgi:hypothetical protein
MRSSRLVVALSAAALALGLLGFGWTLGFGSSAAQVDSMHNCPLPSKWAIPVWGGPDGTDADEALATCGEEAVAVAYSIDPQTQMWSRWLADRPEISNLTALNNMQAVLALGGAGASPPSSAASSSQQEATHNCPLPAKWAISVWSGQDGTDTSQALTTCGAGAVAAAYYIDPQTQVWFRWFRDRPEISNLSTVDDMQGLVVLGSAVIPATPTPSPTPTPPDGDVFLYSRFVPPVVYSDGSSTTSLEVHTTGQGIEAIYLESGSLSFGQLYDDGSHGDHTADDGVYTLSGITYPGPTLLWGTFSTYGFEARIVRVGGLEERHSLASLGVVLPGLSYPAVQLDAGISATTHGIFIVDDAGEIFPGFPITEVLCGKTNFIPYKSVYAHFSDAFDFLLVMPSGNLYDPVEFAQRENVPYFVPAKNDVQNIGLPVFDDTATFGSSGRLRGAVYHSFGSPAIMEHELGHAWGIKYGSSLGLVSDTDEGGVSLSHWDEASDINGLMQEFVFADGLAGHLVDNGDGTYRIVPQAPDAEAFAPLELYLMGLIPPEEVPPVHRLVDPDYSDPNRVTAEQVETITIQQLMAAEGGPRIPDHTASPKTLTAALIAVSDRSFSQAEYDFFSAMAQYLASTAAPKAYVAPLYAATGGRATLETRLPPPAPP